MPRFGDQLAEVLQQLGATPPQIEPLRLEGNNLTAAAAQVAAALGFSGGLASGIFAGSNFTVLPHDTLGLTKTAAQSVANAGYTTLTWNAASTVNWRHGMSYTPASSPTTIVVGGHASDNLYLVTFGVQWASDTTGYREVRVQGLDAQGSSVLTQPFTVSSSPTGTLLNQTGAVVLHAAADGGSFYLDATQDTAGALNISAGRFSVTRLR